MLPFVLRNPVRWSGSDEVILNNILQHDATEKLGCLQLGHQKLTSIYITVHTVSVGLKGN